jgi:hypothetical protein
VDTCTDGELETFGLLQMGIELAHGSKHAQTSPYGSLGISNSRRPVKASIHQAFPLVFS